MFYYARSCHTPSLEYVQILFNVHNTNFKLLFLQGKCQRKEPPCKYLHPPQHLKEQLLQNGRQNLAIK